MNESKALLLAIEIVVDLIKVLKRHPDVNPDKLKVDLFLDASYLGPWVSRGGCHVPPPWNLSFP